VLVALQVAAFALAPVAMSAGAAVRTIAIIFDDGCLARHIQLIKGLIGSLLSCWGDGSELGLMCVFSAHSDFGITRRSQGTCALAVVGCPPVVEV
jgi:hypothetical protein